MVRRTLFLLAFAAVATGTGCNGGATNPPPFATGRAVLPQHLYVVNSRPQGFPGGGVLQFNLPLTVTSTPNFTVQSINTEAVALDADGNLAAADSNGDLMFFSAPLSGASVPSAVFKGSLRAVGPQLAFANSGDMWIAEGLDGVSAFRRPFSNTSIPSASLANAPIVGANGAVFDGAQNLYIANNQMNAIRAPRVSNLLVYAPPYTGAPLATPNVPNSEFGNLAMSATQLFVADIITDPGRVHVFNLPITTASVPAFDISNGRVAAAVAVDAAGMLYVGDDFTPSISVYAPPFSASSMPIVTLTLSRTFGIGGLTVGR